MNVSPAPEIVADPSRPGRPMLGPSHPSYGQVSDATPQQQVSLPALPEMRRWVDRTQSERDALQARADRLREQFEPLRRQLAGVERSIKVLDHFLAQVSIADSDAPLAPLKASKSRQGGRLQDGQWSRKYAACRDCGTTDKDHKAQGYCGRCYDHHVNQPAAAQAPESAS